MEEIAEDRAHLATRPSWPFSQNKIGPILKQYVNSHSVVIDIGTGSGNLLRELNGYMLMKNVYGIDKSIFLSEQNAQYADRISSVDLNFDKMPFEDNKFDVAFALQTVEHLENPWHFVRETYRILKGKGKFLVSIPYGRDLASRLLFLFSGEVHSFTLENDHISFFTKSIFSKLFLKSFRIIDIIYCKPALPYIQISLANKKRRFTPPNNKFFCRLCSHKQLFVLESMKPDD